MPAKKTARKVVKFRPGKALRDSIRSKRKAKPKAKIFRRKR